MIASNLYNDDDEGEEQSSPLLARPFKPQTFDVTPLRDYETRIVMEALKLQPGRTSLSYYAARQIVDMQRDREQRAERSERARIRYRAKRSAKAASRKA